MALTTLDPKTALIVVDLQKGIVGLPTIHPIGDVIACARTLANAFRRQGLPVVLVNVEGGAPGRTEQPPRTAPWPEGWADLIPELDRQPGDAGLDAHPDIGGDVDRIVRIAILEIGIHRNVGRRCQFVVVRQHHVAAFGAVRQAERMGVAGTGGGQRLEAEALQIKRRADIPRIGNDKAAAVMQRAKDAAFVGGGRLGHGALWMKRRDRATITRTRTMPFRDGGHDHLS